MTLKLGDLTDERTAEWLKREAVKRPTMVALAYRLLRAFIRWCNDTKSHKGSVSNVAYSARGAEACPHASGQGRRLLAKRAVVPVV
jgi:hypothetical protein